MTIICVAALFWFLNKTRTGKSMRAYSDNENLALLSGINPDEVVMITWILVAALVTLLAHYMGSINLISHFTYLQLLLLFLLLLSLAALATRLGRLLAVL